MDAIFENKTSKSVTSADREKKYYHIYAEGDVSDADFKGGFNAVLEDVKVNGYQKIIIDLKKVTSTPFLSRTWLLSTYLPELYKAVPKGLQIGIINTDSWIEGATITLMVTSVQALGFNLGIKFYKNVPEAQTAFDVA